MKIGERIKQIRTSKKITQKQLAEMINKNIRTVQKYESGDIDIPLDSIYEISKALNVDMKDIYNKKGHLIDLVDRITTALETPEQVQISSRLDIFNPILSQLNVQLVRLHEGDDIKIELIDGKDNYVKVFNTEEEFEQFLNEIKFNIQSSIERLKYFDEINKEDNSNGK